MRIEFRRSGGYPNIPLEYHLDTDSLPPNQTRGLHELIEAAGAAQLKQADVPPIPAGAADYFTYEISVSRGQSISVTDVNTPDRVRPLIERLSQMAMQEKLRRAGKGGAR